MRRYVGLMSGTSVDGIDAALLAVEGTPPDDVSWSLEAFLGVPFEDGVRTRILAALAGGTPASLTALHADLGEWFAAAVVDLLRSAGVDPASIAAIGSHGQTIRHDPPTGGRRGATLQLGDPATIANRTGIPVVSDFRSADVAAGGQGAPLVPWPDRVLLAVPGRARVILNVGGMANLTWVPARGDPRPPVAFDTGPGNVLLDAAAGSASGGAARCDRDGRGALAGTVDAALLETLLRDPFYKQEPPRSTGRERFGPGLVEALAESRGLVPGAAAGWDDLLATLTALTGRTVADAMARWVVPRPVDEVVVAGGGARNPALVDALERSLRGRGIDAPVRVGADALGLDPDAREAAAFALLAWAHLEGWPGNVPSCTGAEGSRILGSLTPAPGRGRAG